MSLSLYPQDAPKDIIPVKIIGDGNCIFRSDNDAVFASENAHVELRVRTAKEMAANEELYLDNSFLYQGYHRYEEGKLIKWPSVYAQYVQHYDVDGPPTLFLFTIIKGFILFWFKCSSTKITHPYLAVTRCIHALL